MIYLVNYADEQFKAAQKYNKKTALKVGGVDVVFECNPKQIDEDFYAKHQEILSQKRGAGYWLWKLYFIKKYLQKINDGDTLIYADSGSFFCKSILPLAALADNYKQDVIPFELELMEGAWCKRDAFYYMGCEGLGFEQTRQRLASFIVIKKSQFSVDFIDQYLAYCSDPRIVTDNPNVCGLDNFPDFSEHRHDQSIFSLLTKLHKLQAFRDPSQWGTPRLDEYVNSAYGQIIEHTRSKAPKEANFLYRIKRKIIPKRR